jgi:hypothetical protein
LPTQSHTKRPCVLRDIACAGCKVAKYSYSSFRRPKSRPQTPSCSHMRNGLDAPVVSASDADLMITRIALFCSVEIAYTPPCCDRICELLELLRSYRRSCTSTSLLCHNSVATSCLATSIVFRAYVGTSHLGNNEYAFKEDFVYEHSQCSWRH